MIRLYLDTSNQFIHIGLQEDNVWLSKISQEAFKQQSELAMPMIEDLFKKYDLKTSQLSEVVLTIGPGSYTGIRIAMTISKVLGAIAGIPIYTLNTLHAIAGTEPTIMAMMDARANRAYTAIYDLGKEIQAPNITLVEEIDFENKVTERDVDLLENMSNLKDYWTLVEDVHSLEPLYLKENDQYGSNNQ